MVTTFSARLLHLANRCTPIIGQKRKHEDKRSSSTISNKLSAETSAMKRSSDYYYAYTHHSSSNGSGNGSDGSQSNSNNNKRRRAQKAELQYTAATIQSAFSNAGRPPMSIMTRNRRERALPLGSVDMDSARAMTSAEFDALDDDNSGNMANVHQDSKKQADNVASSELRPTEEVGASNEANQEEIISSRRRNRGSNNNDGYDVASMYMLSGLIQSTRNFYSFSSDDTGNTTTAQSSSAASSMIAVSKGKSNKRSFKEATNLTQVYNATCCNDEKLSEDNSEGLSSWTPSSSYNDFMTNEESNHIMQNKLSKHIDNDNRSDGQSSDMGAGVGSTEMMSSDGTISSSDDMSPQQPNKDGDEVSVQLRRESYASIDEPFTIVG